MRRLANRLYRGLHALLTRRRVDRQLVDELQQYFDDAVEAKKAAGYSSLDAKRAALVEMGSRVAVTDYVDDVGWESRVERIWRDVRQIARGLWKAPAFTGAAVATFGVGIGLAATVVSVVYAVAWKPLPYPDSDRLVWFLSSAPPRPGQETPAVPGVDLSVRELVELRRRSKTVAAAGVYLNEFTTLTRPDGTAARLEGWRVEPQVFDTVRPTALVGRFFTIGDDAASIVLSFDTWQRHFGGDAGIVGRRVLLNDRSYSVVGVMPSTFAFPFEFGNREFWRPLMVDTGPDDDLSNRSPVVARLAAGVSIQEAAGETRAILQNVQGSRAYRLATVRDHLAEPIRPALRVLTIAAIFVLLIACVNVTNLLFARATARRPELALRAALGAGRGRLVQQMLIESLLLAGAGAIAGVGVTALGVRLVRMLASSLVRLDTGRFAGFPRLDETAMSIPVLMSVAGIALGLGLACGLVPALRASRPVTNRGLQGSRGTFGWHSRAGRVLVFVELSLAMVLLVGAGLFVRSFARLASVPLGYEPSGVLTFQIATPPGRYRGAAVLDFAELVTARLREIPGVEAAAYAPVLPLTHLLRDSVAFRSTPSAAQSDGRREDFRGVSHDYFKVMGIRVVEGRAFTVEDGARSARVLVINRALAARYFPGEGPVGQTVYLAAWPEPWRVIGVVDDVRQVALDAPALPQIFVDNRQFPGGRALAALQYYAVRTSGTPDWYIAAVRQAVQQVEPKAGLYNAEPMTSLVSNSILRPRLYAVVVGVFGGAALCLASVGLFALMTYIVAGRTREIGIRMALGSSRRAVLLLVCRESAALAVVGSLVGVAAAALASRVLDNLLFELTPLDPATFAGVTALFVAVMAVASYVPARRASTVDPVVALRAE